MSELDDFGKQMVDESIGVDGDKQDTSDFGYDANGNLVTVGETPLADAQDKAAASPKPEDKEPAKAPEKPAAKKEDKPAEPPKSVFEGMLPSDSEREDEDEQTDTGTVPIAVVRDLRQKNRDLKAQLEQAKTQTPPAAETADVVDSLLGDGDDDDLLTRGEVKKLIKSQNEQAQKIAHQTIQTAEQKRLNRELSKRLEGSEKTARSKHTDFDAAIRTASRAQLLSRQDFEEALSAADPAETLYGKAKSALDDFGSYFGLSAANSPKGNANEVNPSGDNEETSEDSEKVFDEFFKEADETE